MITEYKSSINLFNKVRKDRKVVFTNGCFDIIHVGHLSLLNHCRYCGDITVIGLNSDESIKKIKGSDRPILNEEIRCNTLKQLPMVDFIFIFNDETPIDLIKEIKPDVLIKGRDWDKNIIGSDFVLHNKGSVITYELINGISTTDIINKCRSINS